MQAQYRDYPPRARCQPANYVTTAVRPSFQRPCTQPKAPEPAPGVGKHLMSLSQCADTPLLGDTAWRRWYIAPHLGNKKN